MNDELAWAYKELFVAYFVGKVQAFVWSVSEALRQTLVMRVCLWVEI